MVLGVDEDEGRTRGIYTTSDYMRYAVKTTINVSVIYVYSTND